MARDVSVLSVRVHWSLGDLRKSGWPNCKRHGPTSLHCRYVMFEIYSMLPQ